MKKIYSLFLSITLLAASLIVQAQEEKVVIQIDSISTDVYMLTGQGGNIGTTCHSLMLPELTYPEDITFHDGEETIMAFHVHNARTDGDSEFYFVKNNVIHIGDTFFARRYPCMDMASGGNVDGLIRRPEKGANENQRRHHNHPVAWASNKQNSFGPIRCRTGLRLYIA